VSVPLKNLWISLSLLSISISAAPSFAQSPHTPPGLANQGADHYEFSVGDIDVFALSDGSVPQDLHVLLKGTTDQKTDHLLHKAFLTNPVEASINAFFFRLPGKAVLVDTGAGDFFGPGYGGKLIQSLAAIQVTPDQITDILLTHAHDDHMGGLVHEGHIVFPNATVHLGRADLDFFMDRSNAQKAHYATSYFDQAAVALKPDLDAGKINTFSGTTEVLPGVTATVHPGHTPGSAFYTLHSQGQSLVFIGDIVHVASVQGPDPDITITYDVTPTLAAKVRREAFTEFAQDRTLLAVPHLSFPGVGHIEAVNNGFHWVPVDYGNRSPTPTASYADPHKGGDK
jgi:glyoxylase-like metal-dependent hydrolase (beta-lactamase superfamily II)